MRIDLQEQRDLQAVYVEAFKTRIGEASDALSTAVLAAIAVSVDSKNAKDEAGEEKEKAWTSWRHVANVLADNGATKTEAKYFILASLPNDSDLTHKSVDTYVSRVVDLVPIYQMADSKFAELWNKAKIVKNGEPVEPTKDMTIGNAQAIIKTYKNPVPLPEDVLSDKLKDISRLIRNRSKLSTDEAKNMGDAEKRKANAEAMHAAHAFADAILAQLNPQAEQLPDVPAATNEQQQQAA